jgi:hypothetical protein
MTTLRIRFQVRSARELVRARQRVRQIAGLLGLDPSDQTRIAATVFEMVWQTWRIRQRSVLRLRIDDRKFQAQVAGAPYRLDQLLPEKVCRPAPEDWPWVIDQLNRLTPLNLLEEIHLQNQELLRVLHATRPGQASTTPAA